MGYDKWSWCCIIFCMIEEPAILIPKIEPNKDLPEENHVVEQQVESFKTKKKNKIKTIFLIIPSVLLLLVALFAIPILIFVNKAKTVYAELLPIVNSSDFNDVNKIKSDLKVVSSSIAELKSSYSLISWMKIVPFAGKYVSDLGHGLNAGSKVVEAGDVTITTLDPLLSELGFKKEDGAPTSDKSAQERIDFVVNSIPQILPKADQITVKFKEAEEELSKIDPNNYPEEFKGVKIREKMRTVLEMFKQVSVYISESKPLLESAPYLLGMDSDRQYLVLFQNDKELRATGGFLTAYSVMKVSKAKFEPVSSDDIYSVR